MGYLFQSLDEMPRVLGSLTTVRGPESEGIQWFVQEVRRLTKGGLTLIALQPSQIGPADAQVIQLKNGLIDLFVEEPFYFGGMIPEFDIFALPYVFGSPSHLRDFLFSPFFQEKMIAPLLRENIRIVNQKWNWQRGLDWVVAANRPVVTPDDLRGLRVRIMKNALLFKFWEAMGARPVEIPWVDVGRALEAGEIDALPTRKAHLYPLRFCRHLKYVSLLGDLPAVLCVAMNEIRYQTLRPDIQNALLSACDAAGSFFSLHVRKAEDENEKQNIAWFKAAYLKVDIAPWKKAAARVWADLLAQNRLDAQTARAMDAVRSCEKGGVCP